MIADVSRARVYAWLEVEEINWRRERQRFVMMHVAKAAQPNRSAGPSKRQLREVARKAKRQWDQVNGSDSQA